MVEAGKGYPVKGLQPAAPPPLIRKLDQRLDNPGLASAECRGRMIEKCVRCALVASANLS